MKPKMKFYIQRVRLNQGGYTDKGQYFGTGRPLYSFQSQDGNIDDFLRAEDREEAKQFIRKRYWAYDIVFHR
jgi:hypothetical protein